MKNRIIHKNSFLGITLYKRVRLYEKKIQYHDKTLKFNYPGLFSLTKDESFEFNFYSISGKIDWERFALDTIYESLFILLLNNNIEIVYFEDELQYFRKKSKKTRKGFYFKTVDEHNITDKFLKIIYNKVKYCEVLFREDNTIEDVIYQIVDHFLEYRSHVAEPERKFTVNVLKFIARNNLWLTLKKEPRMLGVIQ